jgi:hypothetical protein
MLAPVHAPAEGEIHELVDVEIGDARRLRLAHLGRLAIDPRAVLEASDQGGERGVYDDAENAIVLMLQRHGLGPVLATLSAREGAAVRCLDTTLVVELADGDIGLGATAFLHHLDPGRAVGQPGAEKHPPHPALDRALLPFGAEPARAPGAPLGAGLLEKSVPVVLEPVGEPVGLDVQPAGEQLLGSPLDPWLAAEQLVAGLADAVPDGALGLAGDLVADLLLAIDGERRQRAQIEEEASPGERAAQGGAKSHRRAVHPISSLESRGDALLLIRVRKRAAVNGLVSQHRDAQAQKV